jgi:HEXXH motif-containing protein
MPGVAVADTRLTDAEIAVWQRHLDGAWAILAEHHRDAAAEIALSIRALTPMIDPGTSEVSASSRESFGCIALSEPSSALTMAVTLIHEGHHNKLSALLDIIQLLEPDGRRFYAPWRQDPRPLSGLLQGAYAHMAIAGFWHTMCLVDPDDGHAQAEFIRWREGTHQVVRTLASSGSLTPPGEYFVAAMDRTLTAWTTLPVDAAALSQARAAAEEHLTAWQQRNDPVPIA